MKKPNPIVYSIVIPAYQEGMYLENTLSELYNYLKSTELFEQTELVIVSADSTDSTHKIAESWRNKFNHANILRPGVKVGKGRDLRAGMLAAKGDYILFMDADGATPLHHIKPFFDLLESGEVDIVIGSRSLTKIHDKIPRKLMSLATNTLIRILIDRSVSDSQCGFKAFTGKARDIIFSRSVLLGWGIDFEILSIAKAHNQKVAQIPVNDWADPKGENGLAGESKAAAATRTLKELFRVKQNLIKGRYK